MPNIDFIVANIVWLAALCGVVGLIHYGEHGPALATLTALTVVAAGFQVWHARRVMHDAGKPFTDRVHEVLRDDITKFNVRLAEMEREVSDVKEAQVGIAGAFRGRRMP